MHLNIKKKIKRGTVELNRPFFFSKEEMKMANKHMNRYSTSVISREMQTKTTVNYHLTPLRMAIIKKSTNHAPPLLGLYSGAQEPQLLKATCPGARALPQKKPAHCKNELCSL